MKVKDIVTKIDWYYPWLTACDFDNVGLLVGDEEAEVKKAVVALDCTHEVLDFAIEQGATAVVTHHPIIFDGLKKVTAESVVHKAIKNNTVVGNVIPILSSFPITLFAVMKTVTKKSSITLF